MLTFSTSKGPVATARGSVTIELLLLQPTLTFNYTRLEPLEELKNANCKLPGSIAVRGCPGLPPICNLHFSICNLQSESSRKRIQGWVMRSVPRAVATGSPLISRIVTRSLPLSVLTPQPSFCKLRHHSRLAFN